MDEQIRGSLLELRDRRPSWLNGRCWRSTTNFQIPDKVLTSGLPLTMTKKDEPIPPHIVNYERVKERLRQGLVSQTITCDINWFFTSWIFSKSSGIMTTTVPGIQTYGKNPMIIVRCYAVDTRDLSERLHLVYAPWIDITYNGDNDNSINIREATDE